MVSYRFKPDNSTLKGGRHAEANAEACVQLILWDCKFIPASGLSNMSFNQPVDDASTCMQHFAVEFSLRSLYSMALIALDANASCMSVVPART